MSQSPIHQANKFLFWFNIVFAAINSWLVLFTGAAIFLLFAASNVLGAYVYYKLIKFEIGS